MRKTRARSPRYCFIDIELKSRRLVSWGTETRDKVEVQLSAGYHRVFLTRGQYNKLVRQISEP